jgi:hypothetical protein
MWPAAAAAATDDDSQEDLRRSLLDETKNPAVDGITSPRTLEEGTGAEDRSSVFRQRLAWEDSKSDFWVDVASSENRNVVDDVKDNNSDADAMQAAQEEEKRRLAALVEKKTAGIVKNVAPAVIYEDVREIKNSALDDGVLTSPQTQEEGTRAKDRGSVFQQRLARENTKNNFGTEVASSENQNVVKDDKVLGGDKSDADAMQAAQEENKLRLATLVEEKSVVIFNNVAPAVISDDVRKIKNSPLDDDVLTSPQTLEEGTGGKDRGSVFRQGLARENTRNNFGVKVASSENQNVVKGDKSDTDAFLAAQEEEELRLATLIEEKTVVNDSVAPAVISDSDARAEDNDELSTSRATLVGKDEKIKGGEGRSTDA